MSKVSLVRVIRDPEQETDRRPLDLRLIRRLLGYMRPYPRRTFWLFACVFLRAVQLPAIAWAIGAVINGPIARHAPFTDILWGAAGVLTLGAWTQFTFHFRYRLALEMGESVVCDLRNEVFAHLQSLPLSFFQRTKAGRLISRVTSDCEAMRIGVQDVLFVSVVGLGRHADLVVRGGCYADLLRQFLRAVAPEDAAEDDTDGAEDAADPHSS